MENKRELVDYKQVIVVRKDLNMRKGKIASQAAHASMKVLLDLMIIEEVTSPDLPDDVTIFARTLITPSESPIHMWLEGAFKKICVYVNSEEELEEVYQQALSADMPCALIEDQGLTEFKGVTTKTCCAIGPWDDDEIDKITGDLKLL